MTGQDKKIAKKRGRPATGTSPTVGVRVPPELSAKIEAWRAEQRPIPSQPEAIRRLVEQALKLRTTEADPVGKEKRP
ncbi:hypothetical protein NWI01_11480 [Nitrobacter winogradskyi]|uniref:Ribbon-helix-helix protein CopG domain-containing protein n=1 Tax=Nitrobacter winogradskyi TaxID=913 RepID=A0A4Y3WDD2_NITWI|nr:hypothetical protein NWI01_11480 [Nitrobacter winogradskyi]